MTSTCILLRRIASPCRQKYLETVFEIHISALIDVLWEDSWSLYEKRGRLVNSFRENIFAERAEFHSDCIYQRKGTLLQWFGFLCVTKIKMACPGKSHNMWRCVYSGHKRCYSLFYQTITTPDGLIMHLFCPIEVRKSESYVYLMSGIKYELVVKSAINELQYYLYADRLMYFARGYKLLLQIPPFLPTTSIKTKQWNRSSHRSIGTKERSSNTSRHKNFLEN